MALRNTPNSTGQTAYELMFGRKVRTRLDLMKTRQIEQRNGEHPRESKSTREIEVGERVHIPRPIYEIEIWICDQKKRPIALHWVGWMGLLH